MRVAVFVVAYNAEAHIRETLRRIPQALRDLLQCIYVFDDRSKDGTIEAARQLQDEIPKLQVFTTPTNQGYGGNQKLGYRYAIEQDFDVVVLLHGDGQYAPEVLPRLLAPFADPDIAAVFGSRMMVPGAARHGGMPFYKRVGNRILTTLQNSLLRARLSEFHSGYRAYRVAALRRIPFRYNTNDFHFDTEIIVQLFGTGQKIREVPIPTYYGDEICNVDGVAYGVNCIATVLRALANRVHLVYHPKFDYQGEHADYDFKEADTSLHQYVLRQEWAQGCKVVELGAGGGEVSRRLHEKGARVCAIDQLRPAADFAFPFQEGDLDAPFAEGLLAEMGEQVEVVLALDVVEHLQRPEAGLREIHRLLKPGGRLLASTGNVGYFLVRGALALGQFNYGKKGILDLTHQRLFTVRSFCRTLEGEGFQIRKIHGFGPPIEDQIGSSWLLQKLDRLAAKLAQWWPSLFGYQFIVEAVRLDDLESILTRTLSSGYDSVFTDG
jgi:glycosyltransferase involved in cell wall biosynthesis